MENFFYFFFSNCENGLLRKPYVLFLVKFWSAFKAQLSSTDDKGHTKMQKCVCCQCFKVLFVCVQKRFLVVHFSAVRLNVLLHPLKEREQVPET